MAKSRPTAPDVHDTVLREVKEKLRLARLEILPPKDGERWRRLAGRIERGRIQVDFEVPFSPADHSGERDTTTTGVAGWFRRGIYEALTSLIENLLVNIVKQFPEAGVYPDDVVVSVKGWGPDDPIAEEVPGR